MTNPAAKTIAERVPLPEKSGYITAVDCAEGKIVSLDGYTADQLRAYGLAVAAEAVRGAEAVGAVRSDTGVTLTVDRTGHYYGARIPSGTKLYTTPLAGSVEVTTPVGEMDRTAPREVWLQIDTEGDSEDRSEAIPRESWDRISWNYESMGGQEVRYIRADLAGSVEVTEDLVEYVARALAIREGWEMWDTAKNFNDTLSGNDPEDEREYWRETARCAIAALTAALQEPSND